MTTFRPFRLFPLSLAVAVWFFSGAVATAEKIDINVFTHELAPYGQWVQTGSYGPAWIPSNMPTGWRPYTDGHWAWTQEYGWTWVSDYEWGWAPFHYGRWLEDTRNGWMWIPGTQWAPAWVAWRTDNDHVGWAPLPPQVRWRGTSPLRISDRDLDSIIGRNSWIFVNRRQFVAPDLRQYVLPMATVLGILPRSRNVTYYTPIRSGIANRSIDLPFIEQVVGTPVPRLRIARVDTFDDYRARRRDADRVYVYEPRYKVQQRSGGPLVIERGRMKGERPTTSLVQVPVDRSQRQFEKERVHGNPHKNVAPRQKSIVNDRGPGRGNSVREKGHAPKDLGAPVSRETRGKGGEAYKSHGPEKGGPVHGGHGHESAHGAHEGGAKGPGGR